MRAAKNDPESESEVNTYMSASYCKKARLSARWAKRNFVFAMNMVLQLFFLAIVMDKKRDNLSKHCKFLVDSMCFGLIFLRFLAIDENHRFANICGQLCIFHTCLFNPVGQ